MSVDPLAAEVADLAGRVARLRPDWQDPEAFFERRSDLAAALRRLARRLDDTATAPAPTICETERGSR